jgi:hypothetical protein
MQKKATTTAETALAGRVQNQDWLMNWLVNHFWEGETSSFGAPQFHSWISACIGSAELPGEVHWKKVWLAGEICPKYTYTFMYMYVNI